MQRYAFQAHKSIRCNADQHVNPLYTWGSTRLPPYLLDTIWAINSPFEILKYKIDSLLARYLPIKIRLGWMELG